MCVKTFQTSDVFKVAKLHDIFYCDRNYFQVYIHMLLIHPTPNQPSMASNKTLSFLSWSLIFLLHLHLAAAQDVRGGYWFPSSEFPVANIDSTLFTHLFCAFANLDSQTNQLTVAPADKNAFSTFTAIVQRKNPSVKTLLSIGGGRATPNPYGAMVSQSSSRKAFIDSSIKLARQYKFHGLDLDWEYPQTQTQMDNLGVLFKEWRTAIVAEARTSGQPQLLLAAATSFSPRVDSLVYPTGSVNNNLDFINVMAYDFYAPKRTRITSGHAILNDPSTTVSGSSGIRAWIQAGIAATKLVFGLPYYGYGWKLANPQAHGLGDAAVGPAFEGDGDIRYNAIIEFIAKNKATAVHDATLGFDYCYAGTTWISYDDTQTISQKVSYAKKTGLRGYFAWHIANDNNWALSKAAARAWQA